VDAIKYRLVVVIENIFHTRQTCLKGKEYLVKYKGYNHKEAMWMKCIHLDHLLDMVAKFQQENGHKFGVKKNLKGKKNPPKFGLNVDECISPKFKVGENAPKLTRQIHLTNQCGLRVIMSMVNNEKAKVYSGRSG
jgi:hypothetical protein